MESVHRRLERSALVADKAHLLSDDDSRVWGDWTEFYFYDHLGKYDETIAVNLQELILDIDERYQPKQKQSERKDYMQSLANNIYASFSDDDITSVNSKNTDYEKKDALVDLMEKRICIKKDVTYNQMIEVIQQGTDEMKDTDNTDEMKDTNTKKFHQKYIDELIEKTTEEKAYWERATKEEVLDDFSQKLAQLILPRIKLDEHLDKETENSHEKPKKTKHAAKNKTRRKKKSVHRGPQRSALVAVPQIGIEIEKFKDYLETEKDIEYSIAIACESCLNKIRDVVTGAEEKTLSKDSLPVFLLKNKGIGSPLGVLVAAANARDALSTRIRDKDKFECIKVANQSVYTEKDVENHIKGLELIKDETISRDSGPSSKTNLDLKKEGKILDNLLTQAEKAREENDISSDDKRQLGAVIRTIKKTQEEINKRNQNGGNISFIMDSTGLPLFHVAYGNNIARDAGTRGLVIAAVSIESAQQIAIANWDDDDDDHNGWYIGFLEDSENFKQITNGSVYREEGIVLQDLCDEY